MDTPTVPIPFHNLLKVVAIVDASNPDVQQLLDRIKAENFQIEITDCYERDVSDDSAVGARLAILSRFRGVGDPSLLAVARTLH